MNNVDTADVLLRGEISIVHTHREGLHYSELQNTLIEINWVKLILSVAKPVPAPRPTVSLGEILFGYNL